MAQPGDVRVLAGASIPAGWLLCDGTTYDKTNGTYTALFNQIGYAFTPFSTGDFFRVPDLRGCVVIGSGLNQTRTEQPNLVRRAVGETGGEETHTLSIPETPSHQHGITDPMHAHSLTDLGHVHGTDEARKFVLTGAGTEYINTGGDRGSLTTSTRLTPLSQRLLLERTHTGLTQTDLAGSGQAHENMMPFVALTFIIKL